MLSSIITCFAILLISNGPSEVQSLCVHEEHGSDSSVCLGNDQSCCKSLQFLLLKLSLNENATNVVINILCDITLDSVVWVRNFKNLTIQSNDTFVVSCEMPSSIANGTGLYFENVTKLSIKNLTIESCGMLQESFTLNEGHVVPIWCAVYVVKSTDLSFNRFKISNSKGTGLIIYDTGGTVTISNSLFNDNVAPNNGTIQHCPGGGGLIIEFILGQNLISNSTYFIQDCQFERNNNSELKPEGSGYKFFHDEVYQGNGRGGGLAVTMRGSSEGNTVNVTNCVFVNNTASTWGGGAYVSLRDYASNNEVFFTNCNFTENKCLYFGGGGLDISLLTKSVQESNRLNFVNCNFTSNSAKLNGGGTSFAATREKEHDKAKKNLFFCDCTWLKNKAALGSAVDINPAFWDILGTGYLPEPTFERCSFQENQVATKTTNLHRGFVLSENGVGTLVVSNFVIFVSGYLNFADNNGTALYLKLGTVHLNSGSNVSFVGNRANYGGGMVLNCFSVVYLSSDISINFINNSAQIMGGAISVVGQEKYHSRSCFLQLEKNTSSNITISFSRNKAGTERGNSIYASSLSPCTDLLPTTGCDTMNGNEAVNILELNTKDVTTLYHTIQYEGQNNTADMQLIPGHPFRIPIKIYDELMNPINMTFVTAMEHGNNFTSLNTRYASSTSSLRVKSHGASNNQIHLLNQNTNLSISVSVIECPPGTTSDNNECICDTSKFRGVWRCTRNIASIMNRFWIGWCNADKNTQCSGHCPLGFCTDNITTELENVSLSSTHRILCVKNREGRLCSSCSAGTSVYYHSPYFKCGEESLCKFGILFYLASEILPLTIIFVMVIMLNVSFTNGSVNGVILYAQIFDLFVTNFHKVTYFSPELVNRLADGYRFFNGVSNLNFFGVDTLSFCLWKGATTLDVIAWKYVTIVYALCLIWVTVFLLSTTVCKRLCVCWRPHTLKNAAIHGLVAFLTMCYSQCAQVSFLLLTRSSLGERKTVENVVYISGENELFDDVHWKYGLPALFFMLVIVILPPLLLLLYPLSYKVLAVCRLSELKILTCISNIIPIQLFDAFQSCYKDNFRFFSGLYFFYRVIPLILYAIITDPIFFYFSLELFLIIALALTATLQPYKNHRNNVIDYLIFTNLALINTISLYNYNKVNEGKGFLDSVKFALTISTAIQLFLIYLPLFCVLVILFWKLGKWVTKKAIERKISKLDHSQETLLDSTYLPPLRDRCSTHDSTATEYFQMK